MPRRVLAILALAAGAAATVPGSAGAYTVDPVPTVSEAAGSATYTVHRTFGEDAKPPVSVTGSGAAPATPGADIGTPTPVDFGSLPTTMQTTFQVPIANDPVDEPDEEYTVTVGDASTTTT